MDLSWWTFIPWIFGLGLVSFLISVAFSGWLRLSRNVFLAFYVISGGIFLVAFVKFNQVDINKVFSSNWYWGVLLGILTSAFLVRNVFSQPKSRKHSGFSLAAELLWPGLIYGVMDSLLLNSVPVLAIRQGLSQFWWGDTLGGKVLIGILGLLASLLVTLVYHLGYTEYRNKRIFRVLIGNSIITLAFILSRNPFGAIISHVVMHLAAVLRGAETTLQLPPHYPPTQAEQRST